MRKNARKGGFEDAIDFATRFAPSKSQPLESGWGARPSPWMSDDGATETFEKDKPLSRGHEIRVELHNIVPPSHSPFLFHPSFGMYKREIAEPPLVYRPAGWWPVRAT